MAKIKKPITFECNTDYIAPMKKLILLLFVCKVSLAQQPIPCAHAHNDYVHSKPLTDALKYGFTSIEIDVFLHNNKLVVSHLPFALNNKKDIEELYLKPIKEMIERNGGHVFSDTTVSLIFMIDFKTDREPTYKKLKEILEPYKNIITFYKGSEAINSAPLQILISGSSPRAMMRTEISTCATIDAGVGDINYPDRLMNATRCSSAWRSYFKWTGIGKFKPAEHNKLIELVNSAHKAGKQIRFYAIPDKPKVWAVLLDAGVDWINTNKLQQFSTYYSNFKSKK
jgi:glycerophosphoryl diester phosphodiesterase